MAERIRRRTGMSDGHRKRFRWRRIRRCRHPLRLLLARCLVPLLRATEAWSLRSVEEMPSTFRVLLGTVGVNYAIDNIKSFSLAAGLKSVDCIKIFAESSELDVIAGASSAIRLFRPVVIVEVFPELDYTYELTVVSVSGDRSKTAQVTFSTESGFTPIGRPAAPQNLRAAIYSQTAAELFWNRVDDPAIAYQVHRNGFELATLTGISYFDNTLAPGTLYRYEVFAVDPSIEVRPLSEATTISFWTSGLAAEVLSAPTNPSIKVYSSTAAELMRFSVQLYICRVRIRNLSPHRGPCMPQRSVVKYAEVDSTPHFLPCQRLSALGVT